MVGHDLTQGSLLTKALCPEAQVEATTERYEYGRLRRKKIAGRLSRPAC